MPAMLLAAPPSPRDHQGGRVRFGFGAGVDPRHHAAFEERFGVPLVEAWAMTETGGAAWITASHEPRHVGQRCFGRPPAGLDWRVVDGGDDVAVGRPGELLVRRSGGEPRRGFFAGYYKDALATEAAWTGGWFHTGDIVRVGPDGSFFFVDRLKNMIRRSGENIAAVEVESIVQQVPGVAACAVAAVPDDLRGEEVFVFVVPAPGRAAGRALAEEIQASCLHRLAYFKAPGYVACVDALPQTASQKLSRGEVKRRAAAAIESGSAFDLRPAKKRPAPAGG
jgi:acyl-coenzyme A synthetase/AMP-(fatty) acid ligase